MQFRPVQLATALLAVALVICLTACGKAEPPTKPQRTVVKRPVAHQPVAEPTWSNVEQRASELELRVNELELKLR